MDERYDIVMRYNSEAEDFRSWLIDTETGRLCYEFPEEELSGEDLPDYLIGLTTPVIPDVLIGLPEDIIKVLEAIREGWKQAELEWQAKDPLEQAELLAESKAKAEIDWIALFHPLPPTAEEEAAKQDVLSYATKRGMSADYSVCLTARQLDEWNVPVDYDAAKTEKVLRQGGLISFGKLTQRRRRHIAAIVRLRKLPVIDP